MSIDLTPRRAARNAAIALVLGGCAAGAVLIGAAGPGPVPSQTLRPASSSHAAPARLVAAARGAGIELAFAPAPRGPVSFTATSQGAAVAIPSQGLTAHVGGDGVLRTGAAGEPGDAWELVPVGVGRDRLTASRPGAPKIAGAHVTQPLGGGVSVWYHATTAGLEQGFTIARRPQGRAATFSVALRSTGALTAVLDSPTALQLRSAEGTSRFTYSHLQTTDARGKTIPAHFAVSGRSVRIVVTDAGARYPLTVDPLIQQGSKLTVLAGETGAAQVGNSIALSADGNTALIGGLNDDSGLGAAWVFTRVGSTWMQQGPKLTVIGAPAALFGSSVSLSADGDTALIGGSGDASGVGAAWIFIRTGSTWSQLSPKLAPADATGVNVAFGSSVSLAGDGNTALIGGFSDNSGLGAAWVYVRSGAVWNVQGSKLTPNDGTGSIAFGRSVSLSADGDTTLIGGSGDSSSVGAAWVFRRSGVAWTQQNGKLIGAGETGAARFGFSASLSADGATALVGGNQDNSNAGAAWVFTLAGGVWTQQGAKLIGTGQFGYSVSLAAGGNAALVGGYADNSGVGAAWVFTRSGGVWTQGGTALTATDEIGAGRLGYAVATSLDGRTALIGGPNDAASLGAAWVFVRPPVTTTTALGSSANPSTFGTQVTYTATVSPAPDAGTVGFADGAGTLTGCGTVAVDPATGLATCQSTAATAGSHAIAATYAGSTNYAGSVSASFVQTVSAVLAAETLPVPVSILPPATVPAIPVVTPPAVTPRRSSPAVKLGGANSKANGTLVLTVTTAGATKVTATAQLVPRVVKGSKRTLRKIILFGRARVVTKRAATVKLVIRGRAAALRVYRANAGAYRIRITLISRSGSAKPVTRQILLARSALRGLQVAGKRSAR